MDGAGRWSVDEERARSGRLRMARSLTRRLVTAARGFRTAPTRSEQLLRQALRRRQLHGAVFRRQHPIGRVIVDFCCPASNLIVEIDGPVHEGQHEEDGERQHYLEQRGYRVIRFPAQEVEAHLPGVLAAITAALRVGH